MRLLPLATASTLAVLVTGCGDHLVDHDSPDLFVPTTVVTTVACDPAACPDPDPTWTGARAACIGQTCGYECTGGLIQCAGGCCPVDQVAAGGAHTCAITGAPAAGALYCWGGNAAGQVTETAGADVLGPFRVRASSVTAVATGKSHTCAVVSGPPQTIECWGSYDDGTPLGHTIGSVAGVIALAAGDSHTCALEDSGAVKCWGSGTLGQRGGTAAVAAPVTQASHIAAGANHTCALVSGGVVKCWGAGTAGQLGLDPAPAFTTTANTVVTLSAIGAVGAGGNLSCGAAQVASGGGIDDALQCWGTGLGSLFSTTLQKTPAIPMKDTNQSVVRFQVGVGALAVGRAHVCVRRPELAASVECLGVENAWGQLGGTAVTPPEARPVSNTQDARAFTAGADHSCAIMSSRGLECWGRNSSGQLGDGTTVTPHLDGDPRVLGAPVEVLGRSTP